jgi:hypothetical protein
MTNEPQKPAQPKQQTIWLRLIEGDFPDPELISKGNQDIARVEHDKFSQALRPFD